MDVDTTLVSTRQKPKPAGYCAQTSIEFGGLRTSAMLYACATCSVMPEEIACAILNWTLDQYNKKLLSPKDRHYPIVRIERYEEPATIAGVGTDDKMAAKWGVVFRAEFVRPNLKSGNE